MTVSMYDISVPVYQRQLKALATCLTKAEQHAAARKIDPAVLVNARLYPDMYPLVKQVQIACDHAKGVSRLAGSEPPPFADDEKTFADLQARIVKTLDFIAKLSPAKFEGVEGRDINFKIGTYEMSFKGLEYVVGWGMPNFYFHITAAYAILRHNGCEVGKRDFLGM